MSFYVFVFSERWYNNCAKKMFIYVFLLEVTVRCTIQLPLQSR